MSLYRLARPFLFGLDPERAHELSIKAAGMGLRGSPPPADARLAVSVAGIAFGNPLGLAAGYDKGAQVPQAMWASGFGHAEVGTITPRPQPGNPRPRVFRLPAEQAVINRYGFNSEGFDVVEPRIERLGTRLGVLGINVGANKDSADFAADYAAGVARFARHADYLTINVSSPNTPGLRALQKADALRALIERVGSARGEDETPVFLKIAPDLTADDRAAVADAVRGTFVAALIVSNTTLDRSGVSGPHASEAGGLSGQPLFERATVVLAQMAGMLPEMAMIGVGGVGNATQAFEKLRAGASLVQLYTGMIYGGPALPGTILRGLSGLCDRHGLANIAMAIGSGREEWAARSFD